MKRIPLLILVLVMGIWSGVLQSSSWSASASDSTKSELADTPDWVPPGPPAPNGYSGFIFSEPLGGDSFKFSLLVGRKVKEEVYGTYKPDWYCQSLESASCNKPGVFSNYYQAFLPICSPTMSNNCIEKFWIKIGEDKYEPQFETYMPENPPFAFTADEKANLPEGKAPSIWTLKGQGNQIKMAKFAVGVYLTANKDIDSPRFSTPDISITVDPIEIVSGAYQAPIAGPNGPWIMGATFANSGNPVISYCAAIANGLCAKRTNHMANVRYGISIRLSDPPLTWIHGRVKDANFVSDTNTLGSSWSIEGEPITSPVLSGWVTKRKLNEALNYSFPEDGPSGFSSAINSFSSSLDARYYNAYISLLGDRALALQKRWSVRTIRTQNLGYTYNTKDLQDCIPPNSIAGIVSTNSTLYQAGPPSWNPLTASLEYRLISPHFGPSGEEFLGDYQLKMNSAFARCIYNFQNSQLNASVSVLEDNGKQKIYTSAFSLGENWFTFNASGFTYSAPTVRVQLFEVNKNEPTKKESSSTQSNSSSSEALPRESTTPSKNVSLARKTSITCIKGKSSLKVVAVKPKCPIGYKKLPVK